MSSERSTTCFGDIDAPTNRLLARAAKDIGYLLKDCSTSPTDERFYKEGVETYRVGQLDIDGTVVTIYSFDGGRVFNTLQQQTDEPTDEVSQFFSVDWPVEQDKGQSYHSYYFKHRPCEERIKKAHCIHKIKIAIENREVLQEFRCQNCSERVHWTNLKNDSEITLEERIIMLKKKVCNCEGTFDLLKEKIEEENISAHTVAIGTTRGPTATSLD